MPSHYDKKKQCRVGTMDGDQFYAEANKDNGQYFKSVLTVWQKKGGNLKWSDGGVGLRGTVGE